MFARFVSAYGMIFVLILLAAGISVATWSEQHPNGPEAAALVDKDLGQASHVLIAVRSNAEDVEFAQELRRRLEARGIQIVVITGEPRDARLALEAAPKPFDAIACNHFSAAWTVWGPQARVVAPRSYGWPNFLKRENLLNVANQIAVIAILAIGMTVVIVTGGIDLSVGSLIALSAVTATRLIRDAGGGDQASAAAMTSSCAAAILFSGAVGLGSGALITTFSMPPFIVTLGMMLMGSGFAFILAQGQSIYQVPPGFGGLGLGASILGLPNTVVLMIALYAAAHVLMTYTWLGRYLYAVGGNAEAARLSGVPVRRVLLFAYALSGLMAGLGGVIMASRLKSAAPTYGQTYELDTIAAVVVGGASLSGGEGRILGTLIGAFIIGVIQNGMNLAGIEPYTQKVVLGGVILAAVFIDTLKRRWGVLTFLRRRNVGTPSL